MKRRRPKVERPTDARRDPLLEVRRIWSEAGPIAGTPGEAYFIAIGFRPPIPLTIRYRAAGRYRLPMVVAAVQAPDRKVCAVLLTLLDRAAPRLADLPTPRIVVGSIGAGAVRLAAAGPGIDLVDSVEAALLRIQATGLPTWARLDAWRQEPAELPLEMTAVAA